MAQHAPCIAIDFETSGFQGYSACAIGMVRIEDMRIVDSFYSLIRPPSSRICFTEIHGLTWADLRDAQPFAIVWRQAEAFIENAQYLVAHNAPFDRRVLTACCMTFNQTLPDMPFLCTLKGSRKLLRMRSHKLDAVCHWFGIELDHHQAESDARACGIIYMNLLSMGLSEKDMMLKPK